VCAHFCREGLIRLTKGLTSQSEKDVKIDMCVRELELLGCL
jgi:hypothetical protein